MQGFGLWGWGSGVAAPRGAGGGVRAEAAWLEGDTPTAPQAPSSLYHSLSSSHDLG